MNRSYRALKDDMSNCNWVYGNLIYDERMNPRIQVGNAMLFSTCIKNTECQSTGLKDKNCKEIYEKDRVKDKLGNTYIVEFIGFEIYPFFAGSPDRATLLPEHCEVIGNAIQHPELLTTTL